MTYRLQLKTDGGEPIKEWTLGGITNVQQNFVLIDDGGQGRLMINQRELKELYKAQEERRRDSEASDG